MNIPQNGSVLWITGLSGAGKTTIAKIIAKEMKKTVSSVVLLDGDELRKILVNQKISSRKFDHESRLELAFTYAKLAQSIASQGSLVITATVSLFKEIHIWNAKNLPNYFEVFLDIPLSELRRRDPKRIYQNYDNGQLSNVVGLDLDFDKPYFPNLLISHNEDMTIMKTAALVSKSYKIFQTKGKTNEN